MPNTDRISELLVDLGIPKPEADAYIQLYVLSAEGPATGYQVAKALGKDPTSVYKALEELRRRGFVQTVAGRGKQFQPEDPGQLLRRLERDARSKAIAARRAFEELPRPAEEQEVYRLATRQQTIDKFKNLLDATRNVALLDIAPGALGYVAGAIRNAIGREVTVVIKLYREPDGRAAEALRGALCVVDPDGEDMIALMPGPVLHGAFDCGAQLVTYLDARGDEQLTQAFWTPNLFLAYQAHSGLASEIIHTALRAAIARGETAEAMGQLNDDLARAVHGSVDWEGFWEGAGFADPGTRSTTRLKSKAPWRETMLESPRRGVQPEAPSLARELVQRKRAAIEGEDPE